MAYLVICLSGISPCCNLSTQQGHICMLGNKQAHPPMTMGTSCRSVFKKYRMAGMPDDDRDLKRGEKFYNHGLRSVSPWSP